MSTTFSDPRTPRLTSAAGTPLATDETARTAGPRGPIVIEDGALLDKLAHFNRERIPERVVHAVGAGAYGTFEVTKDITRWTKARLFERVGKKTELFTRFSTLARSRGGPDINRDVRGFAIKFYTEDGNLDMVGNDTPVFFVRDPYKFVDFIRSQKEHPAQHWRQDEMWWDFWSNRPESLHQVMILMSDRGVPAGFTHMNGYGGHTYSFINEDGERVWVKFHFKTEQGIKCLNEEQSVRMCGKEPAYSTKALYSLIDVGKFPSWRLFVQIMTDEEANDFPFNPFDLTKVWPHGDFPLHEVGVMTLDRNPADYFRDVEQAAFSPRNVVPGISWSPDKMLQSRIFAYGDAQRYRLGVNYELLPVNRPRAAVVVSTHRDGAMRFDENGGRRGNYQPSRHGGPVPDAGAEPPPSPSSGAIGRYPHNADDHYEQPRALYHLMTNGERERLVANIIWSLGKAHAQTQRRQILLFERVDAELGRRIGNVLDVHAEAAE